MPWPKYIWRLLPRANTGVQTPLYVVSPHYTLNSIPETIVSINSDKP